MVDATPFEHVIENSFAPSQEKITTRHFNRIGSLPDIRQLLASLVNLLPQERQHDPLKRQLDAIEQKKTNQSLPVIIQAFHTLFNLSGMPTNLSQHGHIFYDMTLFRKSGFSEKPDRDSSLKEISQFTAALSAPTKHFQFLQTVVDKGATLSSLLNTGADDQSLDEYLPYLPLSPKQLSVVIQLLQDLDSELTQYLEKLEVNKPKELSPLKDFYQTYYKFIEAYQQSISQQHRTVAVVALEMMKRDYLPNHTPDILGDYRERHQSLLSETELEATHVYKVPLAISEKLKFSDYISEHLDQPQSQKAFIYRVAGNMQDPRAVAAMLIDDEERLLEKPSAAADITKTLYSEERAGRARMLFSFSKAIGCDQQLLAYIEQLSILLREREWLKNYKKQYSSPELDGYGAMLEERKKHFVLLLSNFFDEILKRSQAKDIYLIISVLVQEENLSIISQFFPKISLETFKNKLEDLESSFLSSWQNKYFQSPDDWQSNQGTFLEEVDVSLYADRAKAAKALSVFISGDKMPLPDTAEEDRFYLTLAPLFDCNAETARIFVKNKVNPILLSHYSPRKLRVHAWLSRYCRAQLAAKNAMLNNRDDLGAANTFFSSMVSEKESSIYWRGAYRSENDILEEPLQVATLAVAIVRHDMDEEENSKGRKELLLALFSTDASGVLKNQQKVLAIIELADAFYQAGDESMWEAIKAALSAKIVLSDALPQFSIEEWLSLESLAKACMDTTGDDGLLSKIAYQNMIQALPLSVTMDECLLAIQELNQLESEYQAKLESLKQMLGENRSVPQENYLKLEVLADKIAILWRQVDSLDPTLLDEYLSSRSIDQDSKDFKLSSQQIKQMDAYLDPANETLLQLKKLLAKAKADNWAPEDVLEIQSKIDSFAAMIVFPGSNAGEGIAHAVLAELRGDTVARSASYDLDSIRRYQTLIKSRQGTRKKLLLGAENPLMKELPVSLTKQLQKQCEDIISDEESFPSQEKINLLACFAGRDKKEQYLLAVLKGLLKQYQKPNDLVEINFEDFMRLADELGLLNGSEDIFQSSHSQAIFIDILEQHFSLPWTPKTDRLLAACVSGMSFLVREQLSKMRHQALLQLIEGDDQQGLVLFFRRMAEEGDRYLLMDGGDEYLSLCIELGSYHWSSAVRVAIESVGLFDLQASHSLIFIRDALLGQLVLEREDEFDDLRDEAFNSLFSAQQQSLAKLLLTLKEGLFGDLSSLAPLQLSVLERSFLSANTFSFSKEEQESFLELKTALTYEQKFRDWCNDIHSILFDAHDHTRFFQALFALAQNMSTSADSVFSQRKKSFLLDCLDRYLDHIILENKNAKIDKVKKNLQEVRHIFLQIEAREAYASFQNRLSTFEMNEPVFQALLAKLSAYSRNLDGNVFEWEFLSQHSFDELAMLLSAYLSASRKVELSRAVLELIAAHGFSRFHPVAKMLQSFLSVISRSFEDSQGLAKNEKAEKYDEEYLQSYGNISSVVSSGIETLDPEQFEDFLKQPQADQVLVDVVFAMHLEHAFLDRQTFAAQWSKINDKVKSWSVFKKTMLAFLMAEAENFWQAKSGSSQPDLHGVDAGRLLRITLYLSPYLDPEQIRAFRDAFHEKVFAYLDEAKNSYQQSWNAVDAENNLLAVQRQLALFGCFSHDYGELLALLSEMLDDSFSRIVTALHDSSLIIESETTQAVFHPARIRFLVQALGLLSHFASSEQKELSVLKSAWLEKLAKGVESSIDHAAESADALLDLLPRLVDLRQHLHELGFLDESAIGHDPIETIIMDKINVLCSAHSRQYVEAHHDTIDSWVEATRRAYDLNKMFVEQSARLSDAIREEASEEVVGMSRTHNRGDLNEMTARHGITSGALGALKGFVHHYASGAFNTGDSDDYLRQLSRGVRMVRKHADDRVTEALDKMLTDVTSTYYFNTTSALSPDMIANQKSNVISAEQLSVGMPWLNKFASPDELSQLDSQRDALMYPYLLKHLINASSTGVLYAQDNQRYKLSSDEVESRVASVGDSTQMEALRAAREAYATASQEYRAAKGRSTVPQSSKQSKKNAMKQSEEEWRKLLFSTIVGENAQQEEDEGLGELVKYNPTLSGAIDTMLDQGGKFNRGLADVLNRFLQRSAAVLPIKDPCVFDQLAPKLAHAKYLNPSINKIGQVSFSIDQPLIERVLAEMTNDLAFSKDQSVVCMTHIAALLHCFKVNVLRIDYLNSIGQYKSVDALHLKHKLLVGVLDHISAQVEPLVEGVLFKTGTPFKEAVNAGIEDVRRAWASEERARVLDIPPAQALQEANTAVLVNRPR